MKIKTIRVIGKIGALLLAGSHAGFAEYEIGKMSLSLRYNAYSYVDALGFTEQSKGGAKIQQYTVSSSLGNTPVAFYTLDKANRQAFKAVGDLPSGFTLFPNVAASGRDLVIHKQLNRSWFTDIPDVGDDEDIWNVKSGSLQGGRRLINLRQAGFQFETAPKMTGNFTHTACSDEFAFNLASPTGYTPGHSYFESNLKLGYKLDTKLTDLTNLLGGNFNNGIFVLEEFLADKGWTITMEPPPWVPIWLIN